jgi:hypothetical protein
VSVRKLATTYLDEGTRRPFDEYHKAWLDSYVKAHCKDATDEVYETAFRLYLDPAFGKRDIGEIVRENVKQLAHGMLAQGKSRTYVKGTLPPSSRRSTSACFHLSSSKLDTRSGRQPGWPRWRAPRSSDRRPRIQLTNRWRTCA